jgi:predicted nuclease of predicted toxin-antitoxin system
VADLGLDQASDDDVWDYARVHGFAIVSKDADYADLSVLRGHPPKVVWLQLGNSTTRQVEQCLRANYAYIEAFDADPSLGVIAVR